MSDFVACASCGARNSREAVWCTMCFEPLRAPEPQDAVAPVRVDASSGELAASVAAETDAVASEAVVSAAEEPADDGSKRAAEAAGGPVVETTWVCATCESINPLGSDVCPICGTTIFETMGGTRDRVDLTKDQALRLGLVPGLAHGRLGEPVLGLIVGVLVVACLLFAVLLILSGGAVWGLIVGLMGLMTWGISVFDVHLRITGSPPVLRPRVITIIGGVVILVVMIAGFVAGATAVRGAGS